MACSAEFRKRCSNQSYFSGELDEAATTEDSSAVVFRQEGSRTVTCKVKHYKLDAMPSAATSTAGVPLLFAGGC